ncbi:MAG: fructosamine kinase family protein [Bacteroidota bacterium]
MGPRRKVGKTNGCKLFLQLLVLIKFSSAVVSYLMIEFQKQFKRSLDKIEGGDSRILEISRVQGGSINSSFRIRTNHSLYFAKLNHLSEYPKMFELESSGLSFLQRHSPFNMPEPLIADNDDQYQWFIMTYINSAAKTEDFWESFGRSLAKMHRATSADHGLDHNNYIGTLIQRNKKIDKWHDFFRENRILPLLKIAESKGVLDNRLRHQFDILLDNVENFFPAERPSALHGDLWSGNYMIDNRGAATIFDPAVYYGHREMDIGMTKLFGGFDQKFYNSYNEDFPLESGWEERIEVANLYPLLVHLILFGRHYLGQIEATLRRFT